MLDEDVIVPAGQQTAHFIARGSPNVQGSN